jgi:hypothetical protein
VARKPFDRTFKMFKPVALGAPEVLHLAAIGAELLTRSLNDQGRATFCAMRLHERPTLLVSLLRIIHERNLEYKWAANRCAYLFFMVL